MALNIAALVAALKTASEADKTALRSVLGMETKVKKAATNLTGPAVFNAEVAAIRADPSFTGSYQDAMKEAKARRQKAKGLTAEEVAALEAEAAAKKAAAKAKKASSAAPSPAAPVAPAAPAAPAKKAAAKTKKAPADPLAEAKAAFAAGNLCEYEIDGVSYYVTEDEERMVFEIESPWVPGNPIGNLNEDNEIVPL